jgi:hypothetical protein
MSRLLLPMLHTFTQGSGKTVNRNHDKDILALQLGHVLQGIHDLGPAEIPVLLSQVAALQSALAARLLSVQDHLQAGPT